MLLILKHVVFYGIYFSESCEDGDIEKKHTCKQKFFWTEEADRYTRIVILDISASSKAMFVLGVNIYVILSLIFISCYR